MGEIEREPTVGIIVEFRINRDDVGDVARQLGQKAINQPNVRLGQGEFGFDEEFIKQELTHTVSVRHAQYFYMREFRDDSVSPLATKSVREVARVAGYDLENLPKGMKPEDLEFSRELWDKTFERIESGEASKSLRASTKMGRFIRQFNAWMPEPELHEKPVPKMKKPPKK